MPASPATSRATSWAGTTTRRSWAQRGARLACWAVAGFFAVRALAFGSYVVDRFPTPFEASFLEAKMVHLAWRVQHEVPLYPSWRTGPYVANFFGPVYFLIVGWLGRLTGADLDSLFPLARIVTLGGTFGLTALVALVAWRKYGAGAGLIAALASLGAQPLFGAGLMARPDALADLFGLAGFCLALSRDRRIVGAGGVVLLLALFTKQTTAVYLAAAVIANLVTGRKHAAILLAGGVGVAAAVIVLVVGLTVAPEFGPSLLGESRTPWDLAAYQNLLQRVMLTCPDLIALTILGLILWSRPSRRDSPLLVLTIVMTASCFLTALKKGAGFNYFLPLRGLEALSAAALWSAARTAENTKARWGIVGCLGVGLALWLSTVAALTHAAIARSDREFLNTWNGRATLRQRADLNGRARDPAQALLTDCGRLDIQRGERTVFGDPWLFRLLATAGQLDTRAMRQAAEGERYDWVATTKPLDAPEYAAYEFGLPLELAEAARRHYVLSDQEAGLFLYRPRGQPASP